MKVTKVGQWLKIEGEGNTGEETKTAINTGVNCCLDFMETGSMSKQGQIGTGPSMPCLIIHFVSGRQIGLKTDDAGELMDDMLKLLRGEK